MALPVNIKTKVGITSARRFMIPNPASVLCLLKIEQKLRHGNNGRLCYCKTFWDNPFFVYFMKALRLLFQINKLTAQ